MMAKNVRVHIGDVYVLTGDPEIDGRLEYEEVAPEPEPESEPSEPFNTWKIDHGRWKISGD